MNKIERKKNNGILEKIKEVIENIENDKTPILFYILTFFSFLTIRNLIEEFSTGSRINLLFHLEYILFYIFILSASLFILKLTINIDLTKSIRVFSLLSVIFSIGYILDIIFFGFRNTMVSYAFPETLNELLYLFLTFGGAINEGITLGIRIHFLLLALSIFIYTLIKTENILKSSIITIVIYLFFFFSANNPQIMILLGFNVDSIFLVYYYLIISLIFSGILFYLTKKELVKSLIKDIRPIRLLICIYMIILGIFIGYNSFDSLPQSFPLKFIALNIMVILTCKSNIIFNNISDYKIDKISNNNRPLFNKNISKKDYKKTGIVLLIISIFISILMGYIFFFLNIIAISSFFLYSNPPIRFKRVPVISKVLLGFNLLVFTLMGFSIYLIGERSISYNLFPNEYILFFIIPFSLALNFIDLKDYKGDKESGIKTIPVIFGEKKSKKIISILTILPFLFIGLYIYKQLLIFSILFSLITVYVIMESKGRKLVKKVFLVYLISAIFFLILKFISIII